MDDDSRLRTFRTVAVALGSDPDLALARARQLSRGGAEAPSSEQEVEAYLAVLGELCEGRV